MTTSTSFIPLPIAPARRPRSLPLPFLPRRSISGRVAIWSFLLGLGLVCPFTLLITLLPSPQFAGQALAHQARFFEYVLHPGKTFLLAAVAMPILEEIFYRGLVLQLLRRYLPAWIAVSISTLFFAVTHLGQGFGTALNALALGFIFAALTLRTGSLFPAVLCHASFNFAWLFLIGPAFGITEAALNFAETSSSPPNAQPYPLWWIGLSVTLVVAAVAMLTKFSPPRSIDG